MHKLNYKRLSFFYKIALSLSLLLLSQNAFATGMRTVIAGDQTPGSVKIYWNVIGGSGTCLGSSLNYPNISDTVYNSWVTGVSKPSTGEMSLDKVYADPGNIVGGYKDYDFTCQDQLSSASDSATLRVVNPCAAGFLWNTTLHSCVAAQCADGLWYDINSSSCKVCTNGGCNPTPGSGGTPSNSTGTLTCTNGGNNPPTCSYPAPTIGSLSSSPSTVDYGGTVTISWGAISGATNANINGTPISLSGGSLVTGALTSDTIFTLTANGNGPSSSKSIPVLVASGSFSAPPTSCSITLGGSKCQVTLAWNTVNMGSLAVVNATQGTTISNAATSGGTVVDVFYSGNTFQIKNGSIIHSTATVSASCGANIWNGTSCVASTCTNGANNPSATPACTQCPNGKYWNIGNGQCTDCGNGLCSGAGGSSSSPNGSLYCNNSSTDFPICTPPVTGSCTSTHYTCGSGNSASNSSNASTWTWICTGAYGGGNSGTCSQPKPSGTISIGATCYIALNANTCGMSISGTVTNGISPYVYINGNTTWTWGGEPTNGAFNHNGWAPGAGTYTFTLADVNGNLAAGTGVVSCTPGTVLDLGGYCRAPSGTISSTNCTILVGRSSCSVTISGTVANSISSYVYVYNPAWGYFTNFAQEPVNGTFSHAVTIPYGASSYFTNIYDAANNVWIASGGWAYPTATCVSGSSWSGSTCDKPLSVVINNPANNSSAYTFHEVSITATATADGGTVNFLAFSNSNASGTWRGINTFSWTPGTTPTGNATAYYTPTSAGAHTIQAFGCDDYGFCRTATITINATIANPTLSVTGGTPPITDPTGNGVYVNPGSQVTLTWGPISATSCAINPGNIVANLNGSFTTVTASLWPNSENTFTLSCVGNTNTASVGLITYPSKITVPTNITKTNGTVGTTWVAAKRGVSGTWTEYLVQLIHKATNTVEAFKYVSGVSTSFDLKGLTNPLNDLYAIRITTLAPNGASTTAPDSLGFTGKSIDLTVNPAVMSPTPVMIGQSTTFEALVRNTGVSSAGTFSNFFQLYRGSQGGNLGSDLVRNFSATSMTLFTSSATTTSTSYVFGSSGTYSVRACTDFTGPEAGSAILETDEANNCGAWVDFSVTSLPTITLSPSSNMLLHIGEYQDFTSTATDIKNDIVEHNFDYKDPTGTWRNVGMPSVAAIGTQSGVVGAVSPRGTNTFVERFAPLMPGTFYVQVAAKDTVNPYTTSSLVKIDVSCPVGEWYYQNSCQKPSVSVSSSCTNAAIGSSTNGSCDICLPSMIYINAQCVTGGTCFTNSTALIPSKCGNEIVESGEECDGGATGTGILGLSDLTKQKCTKSCTITCLTSTPDGSPSCGAGVGKVFKLVNGGLGNLSQPVRACTNGALQSSAPSCDLCALGEGYVGGVCKHSVCGDGKKTGGEECDDNDGVSTGKFCTSNCCLAGIPNTPATSTALLSTFTLTCGGADKYKITDGATLVASGNYTGPVTFHPPIASTYLYTCYASSDLDVKASTNRIANSPPVAPAVVQSPTFLAVSQKSISTNSGVALSWITPLLAGPDSSCKIMASPVITKPTTTCNSACIAERQRDTSRINSELYFGNTDQSDWPSINSPRTMISALTIEKVVGSKRASGQKTVPLKFSTIFYASCNANPISDPGAVKVRVSVIGDKEN